MLNALIIVWRESLEALLVLSVLSACIAQQGGAARLRRGLWLGAAGGVLLAAVLGAAAFAAQSQLIGTALDITQLSVTLLAAILIVQMVFWMRRHGRHMKQQWQDEVQRAQGAWGIGAIAALAVAREGAGRLLSDFAGYRARPTGTLLLSLIIYWGWVLWRLRRLEGIGSKRPTRLARLGEWMARHRGTILLIQWLVIAFYALLVVVPAFLPAPAPDAHLFSGAALWRDRLVLLAQFLFWGIWWPFVIISAMLLGRVWCGVLCPEGALSEWASRHGRGGAIPRWMRWSGWPAIAFVLTTIYGQLISVYDYPQAALLILGGSTVAAMLVGYLYGRGKRVWCRYLCPVSGVFGLLARLAPLHFAVDRTKWEQHPIRIHAVDCAPLIDIKHMSSASACHACGRCAGHRDAVTLAARSPHAEILRNDGARPGTAEALLLLFGMLGVAIGAFQWSVNPAFVHIKQVLAAWLVERDILWPLESNAPWWLLTHHAEVNDVFSWLDGAMILASIALTALLLGGGAWLSMVLSARLIERDWRKLTLALTPIAGIGLFLGLTMTTAAHLKAEGIPLEWLGSARAALLTAGALWSGWLGLALLVSAKPKAWRGIGAALLFVGAVALICATWTTILNLW